MPSHSAMPNDSDSHTTVSLRLLLQEIEATPEEYWTGLLMALRQFRQKLPSALLTVINAEQADKKSGCYRPVRFLAS